MKQVVVAILICVLSCQNASIQKPSDIAAVIKEGDKIAIDTKEVLKSDLILNQLEGIWYYHNQPYNGYSLKYHENDTLMEKLGFYKGKRQGIAQRWSENGVLRMVSYYHQNRLTGQYKSFWDNGNLALQVSYENGKKQGEEQQWYSNGELSKLLWFKDGVEDGIQKAWLPNGKLYVNYEAKNGRIFGMMRANSCYKLDNETVIKEN
ncbi:toxin-antitoxin system YwqK family antitoxin [Psychroserpens algicola]|uniref:toxin-antitoxin system YwqK family antitoxin n=1 Tax=Psychroserpens algicola TaxID=1719034 RepID=UPI0019548307|nr:toxin-antitoxin system YwqK family antitoxin [Psychroserpens algicola]